MDPAETHWALSSQGATIGQHEQLIQIAHQNLTALTQSVVTLMQQMKLLTSAAVFAHPVVGDARGCTNTS